MLWTAGVQLWIINCLNIKITGLNEEEKRLSHIKKSINYENEHKQERMEYRKNIMNTINKKYLKKSFVNVEKKYVKVN